MWRWPWEPATPDHHYAWEKTQDFNREASKAEWKAKKEAEAKEKKKAARVARLEWANKGPLLKLREAAQDFLWKGYTQKDYERFAQLLRTTVVPVSEYNPVAFDLRPRMMVSEGCSGSSYAISVIKEMLEAHETAPIEYRYNDELMKCEKNPECTGQGSKAQALGMQIAVAKAVVAGRTLVVKEQGSVASARAAMREMGAHAVMAYRSNVLARMLCEAKDCFDTGVVTKLTKRMGPNADACFEKRRSLPPEQQTKVWIDPEGLVDVLRSYETVQHDMETYLKSSGFKHNEVACGPHDICYSIVTIEALFEAESDDKGPGSSAVERTVHAWSTVLKSLGVTPDATIIASVLEPTRGKRPAFSLHESISNADEVERALRKDPTYAKHVQELKGHGRWGNATSVRLQLDEDPDSGGAMWLERDGFAWLEQSDYSR
jgi:hypothetical protein